jgi:hypothetical protein
MIHRIKLTPDCLREVERSNSWALNSVDVERLAVSLLGFRSDGWMRQGAHVMIVASRQLAAAARTLPEELATLSKMAERIRGDGSSLSTLCAAAFYHLRFENIHPLMEGNGRVGRLIMAAQCADATGLSVQEVSAQLYAHENDYMMVFVSDDQTIHYELLVDVLARITGVEPPDAAPPLPFSLTPLHILKLPPARPAKVAARPIGNFWRKFG